MVALNPTATSMQLRRRRRSYKTVRFCLVLRRSYKTLARRCDLAQRLLKRLGRLTA